MVRLTSSTANNSNNGASAGAAAGGGGSDASGGGGGGGLSWTGMFHKAISSWASTPDGLLYWAARDGRLADLKEQIQAGASVNCRHPDGVTPLIRAIMLDRREVVTVLLSRPEIDLDMEHQGKTALQWAIEQGASQFVHLLEEAQIKQHQRTLMHSAIAGDGARVRAALAGCADVNAPDERGDTALIAAARAGTLSSVLLELVAIGADLYCRDASGQSAVSLCKKPSDRQRLSCEMLMPACRKGNVAAVERAIRHGADINCKDELGNTPLIVAAGNGHARKLLGVFMAAGVDPNAINKEGLNAVLAANHAGFEDDALALLPLMLEAAQRADASTVARLAQEATVVANDTVAIMRQWELVRDAVKAGTPEVCMTLDDVRMAFQVACAAVQAAVVAKDTAGIKVAVANREAARSKLLDALQRNASVESASSMQALVSVMEQVQALQLQAADIDPNASLADALKFCRTVANNSRAVGLMMSARQRRINAQQALAEALEEEAGFVFRLGRMAQPVLAQLVPCVQKAATQSPSDEQLLAFQDEIAKLQAEAADALACGSALAAIEAAISRRAKARTSRTEFAAAAARAEADMLNARDVGDATEVTRLEAAVQRFRQLEEAQAAAVIGATDALEESQKCLRKLHASGLPEATQGLSATVAADAGVATLLDQFGVRVSRRLADYEILGEFVSRHVVKRARRLGTSHITALKQFNVSDVSELRRELRVPSRVRHANVLSVQLAFVDGPFVYLETPWMAGGNLDAWLTTSHTAGEALEMALGIAQGLHALHGVAVVHGDLKPANVLLDEGNVPKIADFGLSRESTGATAMVGATLVLGYTAGFAAPELMTAGASVTFASDMFALGKVLESVIRTVPTHCQSPATRVIAELAIVCQREEPSQRPTIVDVLAVRELQTAPSIALQERQGDARISWLVSTAGVTESSSSVEWAPYPLSVNLLLERQYAAFVDAKSSAETTDRVLVTVEGQQRWVVFSAMQEVVFSADGSESRRRVLRRPPTECPFPRDWPTHAENCALFPVAPDSNEFSAVLQQMRETMETVHISRLERIQNRHLWIRYSMDKALMQQRLGDGGVNEQLLFHGTRNTDPALVYNGLQGFDFRLSKGIYFGSGVYFAERASYSHAYTHLTAAGENCMLLARVLCGRIKEYGVEKAKTLRRPPELPDGSGLYDSVAGGPYPDDGAISTRMVVVYEMSQAYPQYLIFYSTRGPTAV